MSARPVLYQRRISVVWRIGFLSFILLFLVFGSYKSEFGELDRWRYSCRFGELEVEEELRKLVYD